MVSGRSIVDKRIREGSRTVDVLIYAFAAVTAFITLYPMYYVLVMSVSSPIEAATMRIYWFPKGFYWRGYKNVLGDPRLWRSYLNTAFYAGAQSLLMLTVCSLAAYPLTVKKLAGRKYLTTFLLIPMYFSGGLIPTFILITRLGLYNSPLSLIILGSYSIWNTILMKAYFGSVSESLRESAKIDGANHYTILTRLYLPVSKPILAVIALYTIVGVWNSWFAASIYITSREWQPLQIYLRQILVQGSIDLTREILTPEELAEAMRQKLSNEQLKYTVIVISTLPMMVAYPFFQKYFVQGVMLGSLKE